MSQPRTILAFDTSLSRCSVGVLNKDTKRIVSKIEAMERGHVEALVPLIGEVLSEAGLAHSDLEAVAVPLGPGAFTGLRIGLSAAQALGLSLDIPVVGLPTFSILSRQFFAAEAGLPSSYEALGILIEPRRSDFYVQVFDAAGAPLTEPSAQEGAEIAAAWQDRALFWAGDAATRFAAQPDLPESFGFGGALFPDPAVMIGMASECLSKAGTPKYSPVGLEPLYLRGADVSVSKVKLRSLS